jgi:hypothetical protein
MTVAKFLWSVYGCLPRKPRLKIASFTDKLFPMKPGRFDMETALRAPRGVDVSMKATLPGWPVCLSSKILEEMTTPAFQKRVLSRVGDNSDDISLVEALHAQ